MYAEAARPPDAHVHTACYNLRKPSDTMEWSLYLCLSFCVMVLPIVSYWTDRLFFPPSHANPVGVGAVLCRPVSGSTVPCFDELFAARPHELFLAAEVGTVPQTKSPMWTAFCFAEKAATLVRTLQEGLV